MKDNNNNSPSPNEHNFDRDVPPNPQNNDTPMQPILELIGTYQGSPFSSDFSDKVMHAIKHEPTSSLQQATIYSLFPPSILKIAAAILVLAVAGFFVWNQPRSYSSSFGTMSSVTFPDGSTVLLNSGSTISFRPFAGKSTRSVQLHGEGFFDITSSDKPFIVETFNANIRVLGTRFSVTSWPSSFSEQTSITLEEGKIAVHPSGIPQQVTELNPQQSLIVFSDASISSVQEHSFDKTQHMLSWRNGGYVFQDVPLGAIMQELQRRGDIRIVVPDELIHQPVTYIEPRSLSVPQVLEILSQAHAFSYAKTANGFELSTTF